MSAKQGHAWLRPVVEYGPVVLFFISVKFFDLMTATAVLIVASVLAVGTSLIRTRQLAWAPLVTTIIVVIFGGLTLIFHDETFVKMKPTVVNGLFAVTLWSGLLFKKPMLQHVLGEGLRLDETGWRKLEFRFGCFFAAVAVANEAVWRTQTTDLWADFKLSVIGFTFLFMLTQLPMIRRHMLVEASAGEGAGG
ncbi:MAG TPA: septation protein IspZ [Candidatus Cybelea sp.]|nr:septation protein IspZ [Candidatus Cybelea sp.]